MRALIFILAGFLLVACGGAQHKTPITRAATGSGSRSPKGNEVIKPGVDSDGKPVSGCLNLLNMLQSLTKKTTAEYFVYTSNEDLGELTSVGGDSDTCFSKFISEEDTVPKAAVFLQKTSSLLPLSETNSYADILSSSQVGEALAVSAQKLCDTAQLKGSNSPAKVVCKDAKSITLNTGPDQYVQYVANDSSITITTIQPVNAPDNCQNTNPKKNFKAKIVTEISWQTSDRLTLASKFGELINRYVNVAPPELQSVIAPRNPDGSQGKAKTGSATTISLSARNLDYIFDQFAKGHNQLKCTP